jgi:hypothetical protein
MPGAGSLSQAELQAASQKSCNVIDKLGPQIQWVESYVTNNKIYCIYQAPGIDLIKQHAEQAGFPANRIEEIKTVISPVTAEEKSAVPA